MIWLTLISLAIPLAIAVWKVQHEQHESRIRKIGLTILLIAAGIASILTAFIASKNARRLADEQSRWESDTSTQISLVGAKAGDESLATRYIGILKELGRQSAQADTETAAKSLFDSETDRQKRRQELNEANQRVLATAELRYQPALDLVLSKFDAWVLEIQKRGYKITTVRNDFPAVKISVPRYWRVVRQAIFEDGDSVTMQSFPVSVDDAAVNGELDIMLSFDRNPTSGKEGFSALMINVTTEFWRINNPRPSKFKYREHSKISQSPISDDDFRSGINEAMNEIMDYAVDESLSMAAVQSK